MLKTITALSALLLAAPAVASEHAEGSAPFGTPEDTAYAEKVWNRMAEERLRGEDAIDTIPYRGTEPHGAMLETLITTMEVDGHEGMMVVKRNYGPAGVSQEEVQGARDDHLGAVTIMFQRADGYDPENMNWFWAKYLPDGSLDKNPKGMQLAGRVAKGMDQGCIACHSAAPGDDYLYTTDVMR